MYERAALARRGIALHGLILEEAFEEVTYVLNLNSKFYFKKLW